MNSANKQPQNMKNFLVIWLGELISTVGSGLTSFGLGIWMYENTGLATPFALTVLCSYLPRILISPFAGVLIDRFDRRKVMLLADTGDAVITGLVVILISYNHLVVWHVYLLVAISAIFATFQELAYTAGITMLVPKKDLTRAGGLMQMGQAIETVISPMIAGSLFASIGLNGIFIIDFITYFFAIAALLLINIPQPEKQVTQTKNQKAIWNDITYGWHYLSARKNLLSLVLFFIPVNFLLNITTVLISPLILSFSTSTQLGFVQTTGGIGMVLGSILIGIWRVPKHRVNIVIWSVALSSIGLFLIGLQPKITPIITGYSIVLFCVPIASGLSQAIFQDKVEANVQGRVFSFRTMLSRSLLPLAYLSAGILADRVFNPLMLKGGSLANTFIGVMLGIGPGRGIGVMFVISSIMLFIVCVFASANSNMQLLDDDQVT